MDRQLLTDEHAAAPAPRHLAVAALAHSTVVALCCLLLWATVVPWAASWDVVAVDGASMTPTIRPGDVVLLDPGTPPRVGSVITFERPPSGDLVTHRIRASGPAGWHTAGDASASPDPWTVAREDVVGTARVVVPFVGLPGQWWRQGNLLGLVGLAAALVILVRSAAWLWSRGSSEASLGPRGLTDGVTIVVVLAGVLLASHIPPTGAAFTATAATATSVSAGALSAPSDVTATAGCAVLIVGPKVDVSWSAVTGATTYEVDRAVGTGSFSLLATVATTSYEDLDVVGLTTYHYRVRAVVGSWVSADSATASASTGLCL